MNDPEYSRGWNTPNAMALTDRERQGQIDRRRVENSGGHGVGALFLIPMAVYAWQGVSQFVQSPSGAILGAVAITALMATCAAGVLWLVALALRNRRPAEGLFKRLWWVNVTCALVTLATAFGSVASSAAGEAGAFDLIGRGTATLIAEVRALTEQRVDDRTAWLSVITTTGFAGTALAALLLLLPIAAIAYMLRPWMSFTRGLVIALIAQPVSVFVVLYFSGLLMNDFTIRLES